MSAGRSTEHDQSASSSKEAAAIEMPRLHDERRPSGHYEVLTDPRRTYAEKSANQHQASAGAAASAAPRRTYAEKSANQHQASAGATASAAAASDDSSYLAVLPSEDYSSYLTVLPGPEDAHA